MTRRLAAGLTAMFAMTAIAVAQPPRREDGRPPRPPLAGPPGKWWNDPELVRKLHLSSDQRKKMDDVFQQQRVRLIDLHATLDREEAGLDPLLQSDQLDDSRVMIQIDRIAQARAELEKANARLFLAFRHVLSHEQWKGLEDFRPVPPPQVREGPPPRGR